MTESYIEAMNRRMAEQEDLAINNMADVDPTMAVRVLKLQGQTGLPEAVIAADIDNIESRVNREQFDASAYKETPAWQTFAAKNPFHLAVLKEDEKNLTEWEKTMRHIGLNKQKSYAQKEMSEIQRRRRATETGEYASDEDKARYMELEKYNVGHDFGAEGYLEWPIAKIASQAANFVGSYEQGAKVAMVTAPAFAMAGAAYGGGGGSVLGPVGTAAGGSVGLLSGWATGMTVGFGIGAHRYSSELEGGLAYGQFRDMGFTHDDAVWASHTVGQINGIAEAAGATMVAKLLPGIPSLIGSDLGEGLVRDVLVRPTVQNALRRAVKDYGVGLGGEIATEIFQEVTTMSMGELLKAKNDRTDYMSGEEWYDQLKEITVETFQTTFLLTSLGPGSRLIGDSMRARNAKLNEQAFLQLMGNAENSTVQKELKGKWREFVDHNRENGDVDHILIPADKFDTFFQSEGIDPDEMAEKLGVENIGEARETNGDVQIPMVEWATQIAPTPAYRGLAPDMRTHADQWTAREAAEWESEREGHMAALEELAAKGFEDRAALDKIIQTVTGELVGTYDARTSQKLAQVLGGIANMAERAGLDPETFFGEVYGGTTMNVDPAMAKREDIDMFLDPMITQIKEGTGPSQEDIHGKSLLSFIREAGGLVDDGGELSARDARQVGMGLGMFDFVHNKGRSLDDIAELAYEAGYIVARDEGLLLEAIDREIAGDQVFTGRDTNTSLQEMSAKMDQLAEFIERLELDTDALSVVEIRNLLKSIDQFAQSDMTMEELIQTIGAADAAGSGDVAETVVSKAEALLPYIFRIQDLGDVELTDTMQVEGTTDTVEITAPAQLKLDREIKRKNTLNKLLDCISG